MGEKVFKFLALNYLLREDSSCPIGSLVNRISSPGLSCIHSQVGASPFNLPLKPGAL